MKRRVCASGEASLGKGYCQTPNSRLPTNSKSAHLFFLIFENFNPDNPLKIKFGIVCRYVLCVCMQG